MNDLVLANQGMSSLEVAELTGKEHKNVLRDIRALLAQGVAQLNFELGSYKDANQQVRPCYNLTPKGCLILASGYDAVLREKIVNRLEELEMEKKATLPKDYPSALRELADKVEENARLELENKQKDNKIKKLQPKADFADAAFKAEGNVDIGQAAKILGLPFGRNTLFKKLREQGVFFAGKNEPKQRFVQAGYFILTELPPIKRDNHPDLIVMKCVCTQKGLAYINHLFGGNTSNHTLAKIK